MTSLKDRFQEKYMPEPMSGCWLWFGASAGEYGQFCIGGGKNTVAHRAAFQMFIGDIPEGLNVLHRCDVPCCVNPDHLWLGTQSDNVLDCIRKGRHPAPLRTHCPQGHEYTAENTYRYVNGRSCRRCQITRATERNRRVPRKRRRAVTEAILEALDV